MGRPDTCEVTVDNEGWYEAELAVNNAVLGMCAMDDPDWPYLRLTVNLSPRQAQSLLRELSREIWSAS